MWRPTKRDFCPHCDTPVREYYEGPNRIANDDCENGCVEADSLLDMEKALDCEVHTGWWLGDGVKDWSAFLTKEQMAEVQNERLFIERRNRVLREEKAEREAAEAAERAKQKKYHDEALF